MTCQSNQYRTLTHSSVTLVTAHSGGHFLKTLSHSAASQCCAAWALNTNVA